MDNRDELIKQLSVSMGVGKFAETNPTEKSYFDTETGTLYCDGIMITKPVIEKAEQHFKMLKSKCSYNDPASREMAMIYQVAIEGINMIRNSGQQTIKEDRSEE